MEIVTFSTNKFKNIGGRQSVPTVGVEETELIGERSCDWCWNPSSPWISDFLGEAASSVALFSTPSFHGSFVHPSMIFWVFFCVRPFSSSEKPLTHNPRGKDLETGDTAVEKKSRLELGSAKGVSLQME